MQTNSRRMNRECKRRTARFPANRRLLWLAIVVVGAVFFFVAHDFPGLAVRSDSLPGPTGRRHAGSRPNVAKGLALSLIGLLGAYFLLRRDGRPLHAWRLAGRG